MQLTITQKGNATNIYQATQQQPKKNENIFQIFAFSASTICCTEDIF